MRRNIVYQFKTLYVRNVVEDLIKKKKIVAIFVCICVIFFAGLGIRQGNKKIELSEEQQQELDDYNLKLAEYDSVIADVEKSISEADKQIEELQEYIDESIYMQIDPQNIQTVAVQYMMSADISVGNIMNTYIAFINDGALKEELPEKDQDLKIKYWRDIINCYQNGNTLNVVVVHYDMDSAKRIMSIIKNRIQDYIPEIKKYQGDFNLNEIKTTEYVKADSGMTNNQNNHRNNLRSYTNSRSDLNSKLINNQNAKKTYIEKNEPTFSTDTTINKKVILVKYVLLGIIFGIVIAFAAILLRYIFGDRIQSERDLRDLHLNVLGTYKNGKGYTPDLTRSMMDVELLAGERKAAGLFLNMLSADEQSKKVAEDYKTAMEAAHITGMIGSDVYSNAESLRQMMESGFCILIIETGKASYKDVEQQIQICTRFKVEILGCILVE